MGFHLRYSNTATVLTLSKITPKTYLTTHNSLLNNSQKPEQWSLSHLKTLQKSDELGVVGNYRGIITLSYSSQDNQQTTNELHSVISEHTIKT